MLSTFFTFINIFLLVAPDTSDIPVGCSCVAVKHKTSYQIIEDVLLFFLLLLLIILKKATKKESV